MAKDNSEKDRPVELKSEKDTGTPELTVQSPGDKFKVKDGDSTGPSDVEAEVALPKLQRRLKSRHLQMIAIGT